MKKIPQITIRKRKTKINEVFPFYHHITHRKGWNVFYIWIFRVDIYKEKEVK